MVVGQLLAKLLFPSLAPKGFASVIILIVFFGSLNVLAISVAGEYIAKIFEEVKQRPHFIRRSIIRDGEVRLAAKERVDGKVPAQPLFPEQECRLHSRAASNMVDATSESWRPQLFVATTTRLSLLLAAVRRFFDIQAGSAWRDLSAVLPSLQGTVLDVGCGAQPFRSLINPDATYLGIDTDGAKAHFGYEMPNTTYFSGDVWPVADASVNVVLCTETLEHVLDTRRFLAEAARCLAPRWNAVADHSLCCPMALHSLRLLAVYALQP